MKQSELFCKILKSPPKDAEVLSQKLLLRGDFISQLASGVYSFLPLGLRVFRKIENIIREEMNSVGAQEVILPSLQPKEIWKKSGRWEKMDPPLFVLKDRHKKEFALGSTHEEVITFTAKPRIQSHKDLPVCLYQIQNKFRNEMRFAGGLLRAREFYMKDLYSFHTDKKDLERFFKKVLLSYDRIFKKCGISAVKTEAGGGVFTREKTYEFQVISPAGEDKILICDACGWAGNADVFSGKRSCEKCGGKLAQKTTIEAGHTFVLGERYAKDFGVYFSDKNGAKKPAVMGCYGIGIGRLMATVAEMNNDEKGIAWPARVAPFFVHLIQLQNTRELKEKSERLYSELSKSGIETLYDDRQDKTAGEKFAEADLIGIPWRVVISERALRKNCAEAKERKGKGVKLIKMPQIASFLKIKNSKLSKIYV